MPKFTIGGEEFTLLTTDDLLFAEARAIQKATGATLGALIESEGDSDTIQALVWVSMKRVRPEMKFSDLDEIPVSSVEFFDDPEAGDPESPDPTEGQTILATSD